MNLRARLGRIRDSGRNAAVPKKEPSCEISLSGASWPGASWQGWKEAGFKTLKRTLRLDLPLKLPGSFPRALSIIVPDIARQYGLRRAGRIPAPEELLFFDLETTGLSGGAGTLAFLAAFGRFVHPGKIEITQYLLLDYPGEADFIELTVKEFGASVPPLVVSYNGKSFDSQILRNRCLMNGIMAPEYLHADLLHPARRLWRRVLSDCSQALIEVSVLGLSREGDVPGALAPDIWFSFLKTGDNTDLLLICDHNNRDIRGLASLLLCFGEIAAEPLKSRNRFRFDEEALALLWRQTLKKYPSFFSDDDSGEKYAEMGEVLLMNAAENGYPRAVIAMAKIAEWRLGDPALALSYTNAALAGAELNDSLRNDLEKRRARLLGKVNLST